MTHLDAPLRLLLATDLTLGSVAAFDRAVELAVSNRAALRIVHVVRDDLVRDVGDAVYDAALKALQHQEREAKTRGATDIDTKIVLAADYDEAIVEESALAGAHLTILGAHRDRRLRSAVLGATMERVLRFGDRPVLVVKTSPKGSYNDILVGIDFSVPAREALEFAIRLFPRARFHVLNVCPAFGDAPKDWLVSIDTIALRHEAQLRTMLGEIEQTMTAELSCPELSLTPIVDHGHAAEAALRQIARVGPDLIVVGTHGHTGWRYARLGSVAEAYLARMPCDVLAVRPMREQADKAYVTGRSQSG